MCVLAIDAQINPKRWWERAWSLWEALAERLLQIVEWSIVMIIAASILLFIIWGAIWIVADHRQEKLTASLELLSKNWQVCLLLLVPLFYRTVRQFLAEAEEIWGVKKPKPKQEAPASPKDNPPTLPVEGK